jgi:hypothetical protein
MQNCHWNRLTRTALDVADLQNGIAQRQEPRAKLASSAIRLAIGFGQTEKLSAQIFGMGNMGGLTVIVSADSAYPPV